jgi:hypothetical protein
LPGERNASEASSVTSSFARRASSTRVARATNVELITAVTMAMKAVPSSITAAPTTCSGTSLGATASAGGRSC